MFSDGDAIIVDIEYDVNDYVILDDGSKYMMHYHDDGSIQFVTDEGVIHNLDEFIKID